MVGLAGMAERAHGPGLGSLSSPISLCELNKVLPKTIGKQPNQLFYLT
jgi:hypothetical protein